MPLSHPSTHKILARILKLCRCAGVFQDGPFTPHFLLSTATTTKQTKGKRILFFLVFSDFNTRKQRSPCRRRNTTQYCCYSNQSPPSAPSRFVAIFGAVQAIHLWKGTAADFAADFAAAAPRCVLRLPAPLLQQLGLGFGTGLLWSGRSLGAEAGVSLGRVGLGAAAGRRGVSLLRGSGGVPPEKHKALLGIKTGAGARALAAAQISFILGILAETGDSKLSSTGQWLVHTITINTCFVAGQ